MTSTNFSKLLREDINYIVQHNKNILEEFTGKNILITGSTGLIARILIYVLLFANDYLHLGLNIYAVARNKQKANKLYTLFLNNSALHFVFQDIKEPYRLDTQIDYIFHAAAVTDSQNLIENPVESFEAQILGMINVLNLARDNSSRVVYFSSMEIYGQPFGSNHMTFEKDLGYVNPLIIRNGYPESKRSNEFLAAAFADEYGIQVVNARLAQTFGPGIDSQDSRVFAQFIRSALQKNTLILHTDGTSVGNYCYLRDTIEALLLLAQAGHSGEAYNIVNEETSVTIKQMAEMVSKEFGNGKVKIDIPDRNMGYAPKVNLHLSSQKLRSLGWHPTLGLKEMFSRTIRSIEEGCL